MPMVQIGIVSVTMPKREVPVRMRVRLAGRITRPV
jgi:hypothetical protein